jgi:hypothetical protein
LLGRHTAATWLDHGGVRAEGGIPAHGSKTPEYQPGQELGALQAHVEGFIEAGDAVIASTRISGAGQSSGVEVQMHVQLVVTFREGKVARRQVFQTRQQALEAVGLRE